MNCRKINGEIRRRKREVKRRKEKRHREVSGGGTTIGPVEGCRTYYLRYGSEIEVREGET